MAYTHEPEGQSRARNVLRIDLRSIAVAAGLVSTIVFAYLAVRHVDLGAAWRAFRTSNAWWFLPSLAMLALTVFLRAIRWRYLFDPRSRPSVRSVVSAYLVGQFFNNIMPLRAGEAARVFAVSRRSGTSRAEAAATIVIERVLDVLCLLVLLFVLVPWLPAVSWLRAAAIAAIIIAAGLGALVIALSVFGDRPLHLLLLPLRLVPGFPQERLADAAANLARGLGSVRGLRSGVIAVCLTLLSWVALGTSFWLLALAFDLPHTPLLGMLVVVATNIAQILPSAPAAVGVFEAATLIALASYDVPQATALSYAIVLHVLNFLPYLIAGPIALRVSPVAALRPSHRERAGTPRREGD
jgi:uncharacterized protein (TIRG00374 family)